MYFTKSALTNYIRSDLYYFELDVITIVFSLLEKVSEYGASSVFVLRFIVNFASNLLMTNSLSILVLLQKGTPTTGHEHVILYVVSVPFS